MFIYFKECNLQHSNFECMLHCPTYLHILVTYMFPSDFFFLNFYFPLLSQSIVYILILVAGNGIVIYVMMQVIEAQADMPILGAVTLYSSLLTFTLHVHPDRLDYADQVLVCIY